MKYSILTQNSIYSLSSDYIKHMYPSDKMYKSCVALSNEDVKELRFQEKNINTFAGPLRALPNKYDGNTFKQELRELYDNGRARIEHKESQITERANWKGNYIPRGTAKSGNIVARAPLLPSTTQTSRMIAVGAAAMAVGIILDEARSRIIYAQIRQALNRFSQKIHTKYPSAIGAVFTVSIIYLKVDRPYGRVPMFGGVYLAKLVNPVDDFYALDYVNKAILDICKPKVQSAQEKLENISINNLDHPSLYESAILFVNCDW